MALDLSKSLSFRNHIYWIIIKLYDNVFGYNILPKLVNQLIASSIQIIQIDIRHLVSYYMPISLVYYYMGVFCDIWTRVLAFDFLSIMHGHLVFSSPLQKPTISNFKEFLSKMLSITFCHILFLKIEPVFPF